MQPQGLGVLDEQTEDAVPAGDVADAGARLVVEAVGDELHEVVVLVVEDAEGAVPRADEGAGGGDDALQDGGEVQLARDGHHRSQQPAQPLV